MTLADFAFIYPVSKSGMQQILQINDLFSHFPAFRNLCKTSILVIEPILVLNLVRAQSSWLGISTELPADQSPIRRRIVWMRRSAHCRPQAKKRGKISEKWEYTVGMWNDVW